MARYDRKDSGYDEARRLGYRSRAALKLAELDRRQRIFRAGASVVDLGCWPGGWLQVASERVGARGRVVGVDLVEPEPLGLANTDVVVGDIGDPQILDAVADRVGGRADVLLSDLAPKLSGVRATDEARHLALVEKSLPYADRLLGASGTLVVKLFSRVESDATELLRARFGKVRKVRPDTTRKGSSEIYAVARGRREG